MEITWFGHSCFRLAERGLATVIADPCGGDLLGGRLLKLKGDIVTVSHDKPGHNHIEAVEGSPHIINGPGEYEIGGVFITGVQTNEHPGKDETRNVLYLLDFDGLNVAHLGALNRVPTQTEVEALGPVQVLLLPVGGDTTLDAARAAEVVNLVEPNIVIPMHYAIPGEAEGDTLNKFLKQMGIADHFEALDLLKLPGAASLPEETRVVVLKQQPG
ncbi:MAG: MBL fold metallo-hydrolase [Anaerolineae bacterium]|nr:MBL fold metallo-hydrolase [Anaerolineae bacterium]